MRFEAPTEPGLYPDVPEWMYHADRASLSRSGAKLLLPPSCPSIFDEQQRNPPASNRHLDEGSAAHTLLLRRGPRIVAIPAEHYKRPVHQQMRDDARDRGEIPLLPKQIDVVKAMVRKVRAHPIAAQLFARGQAEMSGYYRDPDTGVMLRFRPDWITDSFGPLLLVDYKTTAKSAHPQAFRSAAARFGYYQQDPWYCDGLRAVRGLDYTPRMLFVVQDRNPPYEVAVIGLRERSIALGRRLNRRAIDIYAECRDTGQWPGIPQEIHYVDVPGWQFHDDSVQFRDEEEVYLHAA